MEEQNNGSIKISEEVIATIAINAALEVDGVSSVMQKVLPSTKSVVGNIKNVRKGVAILRTEEGLELTIQIVVKNGYKIPDVSVAVQTNVKDTVANMTGINVIKTNVIVAGVVEKKAKND
ncbi:MAG: Asp23/Gls24 family envelope stress response protein [Clostridia bacterium]|nr:Asp23/Gls24 family envelope stress response protein [Clostridia bacterium]